MGDLKAKVQGIEPSVQPRNINSFVAENQNIYETLCVINKRSRQIAVELKHELLSKLQEFAVHSDTIEEITENKEQIEISKFYERMPNPTIIAMTEFLDGELHAEYRTIVNED